MENEQFDFEGVLKFVSAPIISSNLKLGNKNDNWKIKSELTLQMQGLTTMIIVRMCAWHIIPDTLGERKAWLDPRLPHTPGAIL